MKRFLSLLVAVVLACSLAACATTKEPSQVKVKCPSCGYEFNAPAQN